MIKDLYKILSEADGKSKPKDKPKPKIPKEEPLLEVKLVDGKKIRDTISVDFIGGGHALAYPGIIPKGEIWIEQELAPDEQIDILVHELVEFALMTKADMQYAPAHAFANKMEKVFRGFEGRWKTKQAPGAEKIEDGKVEEAEETSKGTCLKCGLQKHTAIPHLCPKGRSKWGAKGGKFTTPERPKFKTKKITESEEDLLTIVQNTASNVHPDDHMPTDYSWARDKAFNVKALTHMIPGGMAGWKSFLEGEVKDSPEKYTKLAKAKTIDAPVILSPGHVWDGWHRIAAAIVNGHKTIPAIVGKLNVE